MFLYRVEKVMEGGGRFRIIDVRLSDDASLDFSLLFHPHSPSSSEVQAENRVSSPHVEELGLQQEMRALGLPTRFSSAPSRRPRRRRKTADQVTSPLYDAFSQNLYSRENESVESPIGSLKVGTSQLDGDDGLRPSGNDANHCASEDIVASSRDHQEGKSDERVCALIDNDCEETSTGAIDGSEALAREGRIEADATTIDQLDTMPNTTGWLARERSRISDDGEPNSEKVAICPDMSTEGSLQLDGTTKVSANKANHYADENMASSRFHQECSILELTSTKKDCASIVNHLGKQNEKASLLSCGARDGTLSLETINALVTVSNSRQPLAEERARISGAVEVYGDLKEKTICRVIAAEDGSMVGAILKVSNVASKGDPKEEAVCRIKAVEDGAIVETVLTVADDDKEVFAILDTGTAAQDEQIMPLNGLNENVVVDEGLIASCDARAYHEVAEQGILIEDSQIQTPEVLSWLPCWDSYYGRYYFYNTKTLESTWEPPTGFESYASIFAVEDNGEAFWDGLVSSLSNSEDFVAKESKEIISSEDGSKSEALLHGSFRVQAFPTSSAIVEASSTEMAGISLQSNPGDIIGGSLPLQEVTSEGPEEDVIGIESSFHQVITYTADNSGAVQVDAATCKVSEPTRRAKIAANCLERLENQHRDIAAAMGDHSLAIFKYWAQRFLLFSKYDLGVKLDEEGWFSVTPEAIAKHQAARCRIGVTVDAFTGVGGNAIQFALAGHYVVAIDNDPKKIEYALHNAMIYGVADRIDFVLGDFFAVSSSMQADVVFLSPPWGGPAYLNVKVYDILTMLQPKDGISLFKVAQAVAPNIIFFLPRNVDMSQLEKLSKASPSPCACEVERIYLNGKLKAVSAYYGKFESTEETCS